MNDKAQNRRTTARLAAIQALYQMEQTGVGVDTVILEFRTHRLGSDLDGAIIHDADATFFEETVRGVVRGQSKLDPYITARLNAGWTLKRLNATARAILRAGLYEIANRSDVPARVVINEYVELAKSFFDDSEAAFVNGLLDAAAQDLRSDEMPTVAS